MRIGLRRMREEEGSPEVSSKGIGLGDGAKYRPSLGRARHPQRNANRGQKGIVYLHASEIPQPESSCAAHACHHPSSTHLTDTWEQSCIFFSEEASVFWYEPAKSDEVKK